MSNLNWISALRSIMLERFPPGELALCFDTDGYNDYHYEDEPEDLFACIEGMRGRIIALLQDHDLTDQEATLDEHLSDTLVRLIHGSNLIENAGSSLAITRALSSRIFHGHPVQEPSPHEPLFDDLKAYLIEQNRSSDHAGVLKSYYQVTQHCHALAFLINEVLIADKPLSEAMILETHKILTFKVSSDDGDAYTDYGGVYRKTPVCAGFSTFTAPAYVPQEMRLCISSLHAELCAASKSGSIDPFLLAAKYCHRFVNIHPFTDGNGRVCRLLLNLLLFKFTGVFCVLGEDVHKAESYRALAARASQAQQSWEVDGEDVCAKPPWGELAFVVLGKAEKEMRAFMGCLVGEKEERGLDWE